MSEQRRVIPTGKVAKKIAQVRYQRASFLQALFSRADLGTLNRILTRRASAAVPQWVQDEAKIKAEAKRLRKAEKRIADGVKQVNGYLTAHANLTGMKIAQSRIYYGEPQSINLSTEGHAQA